MNGSVKSHGHGSQSSVLTSTKEMFLCFGEEDFYHVPDTNDPNSCL